MEGHTPHVVMTAGHLLLAVAYALLAFTKG
jgi:hypothetical protein